MADDITADQAADAARLRIAAKQLVTAGRPEKDLCRAVLADVWSSQAPRCAERATHKIAYDNYATGLLAQGEFFPAESTTRLCPDHEEQARRMPGWRWSRQLTEEQSNG
jgi:hypothetical protein